MTNQEIAEALGKLENARGCLTPDEVIEAARDPANPLHGQFIWNDTRAAHEHRRDRARKLIRVVYWPTRHAKMVFRVPLYTRDPSAPVGVQGYRNTMRIRNEPDEAHAALAMEMARVGAIVQRAKGMAIALGMAEALDAIDAQIAAFVSELRNMRSTEDRPSA